MPHPSHAVYCRSINPSLPPDSAPGPAPNCVVRRLPSWSPESGAGGSSRGRLGVVLNFLERQAQAGLYANFEIEHDLAPRRSLARELLMHAAFTNTLDHREAVTGTATPPSTALVGQGTGAAVSKGSIEGKLNIQAEMTYQGGRGMFTISTAQLDSSVLEWLLQDSVFKKRGRSLEASFVEA